ncbi:hypothetical protein ES288_D01G105700v1 [Gossypium darwinii]|uniref:Oberon coiled-coil region domain-containing protein n=1 Tax=Gossypium darwinii TaxID=34276 RepID=A0A5D2DNP6_GOSDA|nr:hypothetical protein ES288_D01G105700v1 [Gossypium darwinii]
MDFQEQFFKERIKFIHEARDEKEESFEKLQQQEREKVKQSNPNPSNAEEYKRSNLEKERRGLILAKLEFFKMEYANARLECNAADERANVLASKVIGLEEKYSNFLRHLKLKGVAVLRFPTLIRVVVHILFICLVFLFQLISMLVLIQMQQ